MGDLALALDSGVGPDPGRARDQPRVDGGKRRRHGVAASERAGMGLAKGFVTLLKIGYGFVGIQLQSRRSDDFTPRHHCRCPEGSVRSC